LVIGDKTNGQDQRSKREYVHWFRGWAEIICPRIEKLECLVDERRLEADVPGVREKQPSTRLGIDGDVRHSDIPVVGDKDIVLFRESST